ncbi:MAG: FtsH-binding integral membrane protein [Candidatus Paceibacteria bacterium]|jgi:FtsH-binding integral membrane protein
MRNESQDYSQDAALHPRMVMDVSTEARATFMVRVFTHLLGAMVGFTLIEVILFKTGMALSITETLLGTSYGWLVAMGGFVILGNMASRTAHTARALSTQYLALAGFVIGEAIIFAPLLYIANAQAGGGVIASAAYVSLAGFTGLAAIAIFSRKDFSFMGAFLKWGMMCALVLIVASVLMGFELGLLFSVAMVALAGGSILWSVQRIYREYPEDRYVGASLELFAAVAMLFWYVLRIFMSRD